eukprot:11178294-Lingulodinium_polyedra.AAC.1
MNGREYKRLLENEVFCRVELCAERGAFVQEVVGSGGGVSSGHSFCVVLVRLARSSTCKLRSSMVPPWSSG